MTDPVRIWRSEDTSIVVRCDWPGCHEAFVASGSEPSSMELWRLGWTRAVIFPDRCRRHPSLVPADGTWLGDSQCSKCHGLGVVFSDGAELLCPCGRDTLRRSGNGQ